MIFSCLLNTLQFENGYARRSPPSSPSAMNPIEEPLQARMGQKMTCGQGTTKRGNTCLDWEPNRERSTRGKSLAQALSGEAKDVRDLIKVRRNILYRDTRQSPTNLVKPVNGILICFLTFRNWKKKTTN